MNEVSKMQWINLVIFFYGLFEAYVSDTPFSPYLHLSNLDILQQAIGFGVTFLLIEFVAQDRTIFSKKLFIFSQILILLIEALVFRLAIFTLGLGAVGFRLIFFYTFSIFLVEFLLRAWLMRSAWHINETIRN